MNEQRPRGRGVRRLLASVVLALLAASCWWGWMAWDHTYQVDLVTGERSGPYEAWQVIGCVLCLVVVCVLGTVRLPVWLVVPTVTMAFTGAWSWTAAGDDSSGLWVIGALYVFVGTAVGVAMVSGTTVAVRVADRVAVVGQRARHRLPAPPGVHARQGVRSRSRGSDRLRSRTPQVRHSATCLRSAGDGRPPAVGSTTESAPKAGRRRTAPAVLVRTGDVPANAVTIVASFAM